VDVDALTSQLMAAFDAVETRTRADGLSVTWVCDRGGERLRLVGATGRDPFGVHAAKKIVAAGAKTTRAAWLSRNEDNLIADCLDMAQARHIATQLFSPRAPLHWSLNPQVLASIGWPNAEVERKNWGYEALASRARRVTLKIDVNTTSPHRRGRFQITDGPSGAWVTTPDAVAHVTVVDGVKAQRLLREVLDATPSLRGRRRAPR